MKQRIMLVLTLGIFSFLLVFPNTVLADFSIIFNFDDGYQGVYDHAFKVMNNYHLPGVVFMPTNFVGQEGHLTLEKLKILKKAGWEIGSHTIHHPDLSQLTSAGLKDEIINSKTYLEDNGLLDSDYASFCSPMTIWDNNIAEVVSSSYQIARGKKLLDLTTQEQIQTVIKVIVRETSMPTIKSWIDYAVRVDRPLILIFHEVGAGDNQYYFPVERFERLVSYLYANKFPVMTFNQLLKN